VLPGKKFTPEDVLHILWNRKWLIGVPLLVATVSTFVVAQRLPAKYQSQALIQIIPQRIPEDYVKATVTTPIDERLGGIQQVVLSRSRLEAIINEFNLYPEDRATQAMEDVVDQMRVRDIEVKVERGDAFRVKYQAHDPRTAQRVAEKLASLFIDENTLASVNLSEQTNQFLDTKLEDAKRQLVEQEKKLEEYTRRHSGELPSQLAANLTAIQNAQMQLTALSEAINRDRDRRNMLERQLSDLETLASVPVSVAPVAPGSAEPTAPKSTAELLQMATAYLQSLQVRFKDDHPDVITAKRRIRDLEAQLKAEGAPASAGNGEPAAKPLTTEAAIQRNRIRDLKADIANLDRQIEGRQNEDRRLRGVIGDYQARVASVPTRESELVELTRDYETKSAFYKSLLSKRENSGIAADVIRQQIGEQFKILDPARVPERPFSPNKLRINLIGAFLGLAMGLGIVGLLEYRDTTFKSEDDVARVLELPVLALVPMMASEREMRAVRRRHKLVALAACVMVISSAVAVLLWKLQAS